MFHSIHLTVSNFTGIAHELNTKQVFGDYPFKITNIYPRAKQLTDIDNIKTLYLFSDPCQQQHPSGRWYRRGSCWGLLWWQVGYSVSRGLRCQGRYGHLQIHGLWGVSEMDDFRKSHSALVPYPTMHHSEQKCVHFCSEWCSVGYGTGALWNLWEWSIFIWNITMAHIQCDSLPWCM